jgi:transcriptional regulator with XRE-family HTH domain
MKNLFSTRLSTLRGDRTKQQFANTLGIPQNTYLRYEDAKDTTLPKIDVLAQIAKRCGVSADWMLGLDDNEPSNPRADAAEAKLRAVKKSLLALVREL